MALNVSEGSAECLPFADALAQHPRQFDDLYVNLVEAGEKSGSLESLLDKIATYKEKTETIKKKVKKAVKKNGRFSFPGFGTFKRHSRKARKGRNPQTGAVINIKASKTVGFRPAKNLKEML